MYDTIFLEECYSQEERETRGIGGYVLKRGRRLERVLSAVVKQ